MPELRKRQAPEPATGNFTKRPNSSTTNVNTKSGDVDRQVAKNSKIAVGEIINSAGLGGEIETHEGAKVTLQSLLDECGRSNLVIFTYPKASTPGCTTQACLFRDEFATLTESGLKIYGLSKDSPKSNTTFKTKQNLPYALLCDPKETLITAIGMKKSPTGTIRGVVVIDKAAKIQGFYQGGPAATVEYVRRFVEDSKNSRDGTEGAKPDYVAEDKGGQIQADVAAQVADTAQELDN
ncbi:uncharacterized protein KY384_006937 [Bacidia gigantensis]|uniref:uncharacterized protein n=1 Tax=Bacidia gigantensis TaxID=2732470 RepID=UPI001D04298C|nr:uncharacterized protein KY384_006937 [Bacidia gigantensis]KAG8528021.1 hypothetical protein KY384_006937 [Bacidia gigantensis]